MKNDIKKVAFIRQRGQLTIPGDIRDKATWVRANAPVTISLASKKEIRVCPYKRTKTVKQKWSDIWRNIEVARKLGGKPGNLSGFIVSDRAHRR